jgi:hypothetical protein
MEVKRGRNEEGELERAMREDKRAERLRGSRSVDAGLGTGGCAVHDVLYVLCRGRKKRRRTAEKKRPEEGTISLKQATTGGHHARKARLTGPIDL